MVSDVSPTSLQKVRLYRLQVMICHEAASHHGNSIYHASREAEVIIFIEQWLATLGRGNIY